jgi:hypothetical protein
MCCCQVEIINSATANFHITILPHPLTTIISSSSSSFPLLQVINPPARSHRSTSLARAHSDPM